MENFVLIYHFPNENEEIELKRKLVQIFPNNRSDQNDYFYYFGFTGKNRAQVEDRISGILHHFGIGSKEYVALYYSKNNVINRSMLLGRDELLENDLKKLSKDTHMLFVEDLLDAEYARG